jgi:hypothetical protein
MKKKLLLMFTAAALVFSGVYLSVDGQAKADDLAVMLPESDGVVVIDVRRLLDDALPQILAANEPMLAKVNGEVDKIRSKTGLDLRKFDRLALGIKTKKQSDNQVELQPVLLARGSADTNTLSDAAELASGGKVRMETISGRTVFIFSAKEIIDRNKPADKSGGNLFEKMMDKVVGGLSEEAALTAYDENTVALGTLERVRELLGESPRIGNRLIAMLDEKQTAIAGFGMVMPEGFSSFLELEDDELGQGLDSVREMKGSLDVVPGKTVLSIAARTADAAQAENLEVMLQGFQGVFSMILKKQKGADKQVYGRMLENLSVNRKADQLTLDLVIPQKDLDVIVGKK